MLISSSTQTSLEGISNGILHLLKVEEWTVTVLAAEFTKPSDTATFLEYNESSNCQEVIQLSYPSYYWKMQQKLFVNLLELWAVNW